MGMGRACSYPGGCPKEARWIIGFRVWPCGVRRTLHNAVDGALALWVCDEHAIRNPEVVFTPETKDMITMRFLKAGRGMPDFDTAQVVHTEIEEGNPIGYGEAASLGGVPDQAV